MSDHEDRAEILDALPELLTEDCITLERHADGTATAIIVAKVKITEAGLAGPAQLQTAGGVPRVVGFDEIMKDRNGF